MSERLELRSDAPEIFGLLAEFATPEDLLAGAAATRDAGYERIDAYTPHPIHGLTEAVGYVGKGWTSRTAFVGGLLGALVAFVWQYWVTVIDYPLNVGGKPLNSWPAYIPITFEVTILIAGFFTILGMLWWNRLPMPYHPVFNVDRFELASNDRFFVIVASDDAKFDRTGTREFLEGLDDVVGVYDVDY